MTPRYGFVRPEIAQILRRWREPLALAALAALGLWVGLRPGLFVPAAGWAMGVLALLLAPGAIRRARFDPGADGAGVVRLSEGQIGYMGPETGGVLSLDDLQHLSLVITQDSRIWHLRDAQNTLAIPVDAVGAEALFDAFTRLPGLAPGRLLAALRQTSPGEITLWRRTPLPALTQD